MAIDDCFLDRLMWFLVNHKEIQLQGGSLVSACTLQIASFFGIPELFHLQFKQDPASEQGGSNLNGGSVPGTLKSEMRIKEYLPASQACEKHTDHSSLSLFSNILHSTHLHLFQYFSLFWFLFLKLSNFCFFSSFFPRMVVVLFFLISLSPLLAFLLSL